MGKGRFQAVRLWGSPTRLQIGYLMHRGEAGWKIAAMVFTSFTS
jgi:hypothetical protein